MWPFNKKKEEDIYLVDDEPFKPLEEYTNTDESVLSEYMYMFSEGDEHNYKHIDHRDYISVNDSGELVSGIVKASNKIHYCYHCGCEIDELSNFRCIRCGEE